MKADECSASSSSYYPKAFSHEIGRSSGLLHPRYLPIPTGTVVLEISRTHTELTAAVSAQDFHLIPFSLIIPKS